LPRVRRPLSSARGLSRYGAETGVSFRLAILAAVAFLATAASPPPYRLAPFKDDLFAYREVLASEFDGDYLRVRYDKKRDMDDRSQAPQKAKPEYVALEVDAVQSDQVLKTGGMAIRYVGVGQIIGGAKAIVINIHGFGDTRFTGVNDWTYGGNQNRLKNLLARNGGAYLSVDFSPLPARAEAEVKALILEYAERSPLAPIFLECISLGGRICWAMARDPKVAPLLGGLILLSTEEDPRFLEAARNADRRTWLPVFIGHATRDPIFAWKPRETFFRRFKAALPNYPISMTLFVGGAHGAPIRMTDWRLVINRMLAQREALREPTRN
jgi:hypothetical protein